MEGPPTYKWAFMLLLLWGLQAKLYPPLSSSEEVWDAKWPKFEREALAPDRRIRGGLLMMV